jgi:MFS family permease
MRDRSHPDRYKWVALSNTTLGILMVTINSSIVLISLPAIFRGIHLDPLDPANITYLLWILQGFLVATAVLVVGFGRLGDVFGRVRMYNLGFAVFTACSIGLSLIFGHGPSAAILIIVLRLLQGVGGALLFANSTAILTDAFPANQRGMALGINSVAAIAGSFIGLVVGGLLADVEWHLVFVVSAPFGLLGTVWAYVSLREVTKGTRARVDWIGSVLFAIGLVAILVGITYGIQPYGGHTMGWTNPTVLSEIGGGFVVLIIFGFYERHVPDPMLDLSLLRNRPFAAGNLASLLSAIGRGGLLFLLVIWLQGIWLPLHGYSFEQTPFWSAIYMLPLTAGFLVAGPLAGVLSDRMGPRPFTIGGLLVAAAAFVLLGELPTNFVYWQFGLLLLVYGLGMGAFSSPNSAEVMNAVPASERGAAAGIRATGLNCGQTIAIGLFFTLLTAGLAAHLPQVMSHSLTANGVPSPSAQQAAHLPPVATLFATFLGYNPMKTLLGPALHTMPAHTAATVTSTSFFPHVISGPFHDGLQLTFGVSAAMTLLAAAASALSGRRRPVVETAAPTPTALAEPGPEAGLAARVRASKQRAMAAQPPPLVITISSPLGAGGDRIARNLADRLDLPFVDRAIPLAVANELGVSVADAEARDEKPEGGIGRLLAAAAASGTLFGNEVSAPELGDAESYKLATEAALWEQAAAGGVVLGRAGVLVLADYPNALHVRFTASDKTRRERLASLAGYPQDEAGRLMELTDRARHAYAQQLYGVDFTDSSLYDLVVSTDGLDLNRAEEIVVNAVASRAGQFGA